MIFLCMQSHKAHNTCGFTQAEFPLNLWGIFLDYGAQNHFQYFTLVISKMSIASTGVTLNRKVGLTPLQLLPEFC